MPHELPTPVAPLPGRYLSPKGREPVKLHSIGGGLCSVSEQFGLGLVRENGDILRVRMSKEDSLALLRALARAHGARLPGVQSDIWSESPRIEGSPEAGQKV